MREKETKDNKDSIQLTLFKTQVVSFHPLPFYHFKLAKNLQNLKTII